MPSTKRKSGYDTRDPFVASDTNSPPPSTSTSTTLRPTKRAKGTSTTTSSKSTSKQIDSDGNAYWALSTNRRVTVSEFKGKTMVSIREYYEKDSTWLPGKKGITMTLEQYAELVKVLPQIEKALGKQERDMVGRPRYGGDGDGEDSDVQEDDVKVEEEDDDDDVEEERRDRKLNGKKGRKSNIEATSDEDED